MRAAIALFPIRLDYEADVSMLLQQRRDEVGPVQAATLTVQTAVMRQANTSGHLAYSGPRPVGVIVLTAGFDAKSRGDFGRITELYVTSWCRLAGVGSALLHAAEAEGRAYGWHALDIDVPRSRQMGLFLARRGFARAGKTLSKPINDRPMPA